MAEAEQHAARLTGTGGFIAMVKKVAEALLERRELGADDLEELLHQEADHGQQDR